MRINKVEGRNVILHKIKVFLLVAWVVFTVFCILESVSLKAKAQAREPSYETQLLNSASDPSTPTARYVLDKLNKHLSNSIADDDTQQLRVTQLEEKIDIILGQELATKVAVISEKVDTQGWILKAVLGSIATLIGKEIIEMMRNKRG